MSWFFGSHKKKEPPVTVDPTPIESGFYCVQNTVQTQPYPPQPQALYPDLNGGYPQRHPGPLPYNVMPDVSGNTQPPVPRPRSNRLPAREPSVEPSNQLESVPFRISPHLQSNSNEGNHKASLNEVTQSFTKLKRNIDSGEFDYDFRLERRILREANWSNNIQA